MAKSLLLGADKFQIAGLLLLHTFDVGGQLVGGLYQLPKIVILRLLFKNPPVSLLHTVRKHTKKGM